jgi:hypothetical protein
MKLPNLQQAIVSEEKVAGYLLNPLHRTGQHKAAFFAAHGFTTENWPVLAAALIKHAADHDVAQVEPSEFGTRYVVEGTMETPDLRNPLVRVIWFVETNEHVPRLVSAYPQRRKAR